MTLPRHLLLIVPIVCLLAIACGGDDGDSGAGGIIPSSAATEASGLRGTPAAGFSQEQLTALSTTEVDGYVRQDPPLLAGATLGLVYEPAEGSGDMSAVVTIAPCNPATCRDIEEMAQDDDEELKSTLSEVHLENPDLVFESGTIEIASGYEAFFTYSRSFVSEGGSTATVNAYRLHYHDGANGLTIQVTPSSLSSLPDSVEELEMQMDQSKGEMAARNFFAALAGPFAPSE